MFLASSVFPEQLAPLMPVQCGAVATGDVLTLSLQVPGAFGRREASERARPPRAKTLPSHSRRRKDKDLVDTRHRVTHLLVPILLERPPPPM
jgi:hypothetical protein